MFEHRVILPRTKVGFAVDPAIATLVSDPWARNKFFDPWYSKQFGSSPVPGDMWWPLSSPANGSDRARELLAWPPSDDTRAENRFGEVELRAVGVKIAADAEKYREDVKKRAIDYTAVALSILGSPAMGIAWKALVTWGYPYVVKVYEALGIKVDDSKDIAAAIETVAVNIGNHYKEGFLPPLHVLYNVRYAGFAGTADLMRDQMFASLQKFRNLPPSAKTALATYMAIRLEMAATDDETAAMLSRLPQNYLADDFQVVSIGFPVARKFGLDPQDFVAKLWDRCPGWRGAKDWWDGPEGPCPAVVPESMGACPSNAMQVQAALIARDALDLAQHGDVTGAKAKESGTVSLGTIAAAGVVIGVLAWLLFL